MKRRVLIIVENLPVPFDRRVWAESMALIEAGYQVSVICPNSRNQAYFEVLDGVNICRYPAPPEGSGVVAYVREFVYSLWAAFWLSIKVRREIGFDVIQACNPPDTIFMIALFHKWFGRKKFIFDHHDLSPELFSLRFDPGKKSLAYRMLLWLERRTFRTADVVISTNESFKAVAVKRGGKRPEDVVVVRNGPNLERFKPRDVRPELKNGREYLVCYVGVMAMQDGLDYLLNAIHHVVIEHGRHDITFALIGSGDILDDLKQLACDLKIDEYVEFTGRIDDDILLADYLSTSDVCVAPDPMNDLNDNCTLIKIPEYMAMGKPIVSFDLTESRYSAQEAALYAPDNNCADFGDKIIELLDDPRKREEMGRFGQERVREMLAWEHSKKNLVNAYELAFECRSSGVRDAR